MSFFLAIFYFLIVNHSIYSRGRKYYFAGGYKTSRNRKVAIIRREIILASLDAFRLFHSETKAYPLSISQDEVRRFTEKERVFEMKDLEREGGK